MIAIAPFFIKRAPGLLESIFSHVNIVVITGWCSHPWNILSIAYMLTLIVTSHDKYSHFLKNKTIQHID